VITTIKKKPLTASALARELNVSPHTVVREFKWWCNLNGKHKADFYRPRVGYELPREFVEYMEQLVRKKAL